LLALLLILLLISAIIVILVDSTEQLTPEGRSMLKSTQNTLTRDQFVKLREVRQRVKDQFGEDFSLQSGDAFADVYKFALQSETNELFSLFTVLNTMSNTPLERPLNLEQFVLLREAKKLIVKEFDEELVLVGTQVMDSLYEFALSSKHENLLDIYMYLMSRNDCPLASTSLPGGPRFRKFRLAHQQIKREFDESVSIKVETAVETVSGFAERSADSELEATLNKLQEEEETGSSELAFKEISAPDFERLREAKISIRDEFELELSLHADTMLDDLYGFALRSIEVELFELFRELLAPQSISRGDNWPAMGWLSKEQFDLLRITRERVQAEFDSVLDLRSTTILHDIYQYALRAEKEELFDLCWEFQRLSATAETLPSKDEFQMLRRARTLIGEEFGQELQLESDALEYDLYKFAVSSDGEELFDLYTDLMALPARVTSLSTIEDRAQLSREEFALLRVARRLVQQEFDQHLALETADVLDRLYGYALDSEEEALFDLHAELNADAEGGLKTGDTQQLSAENTAISDQVKPNPDKEADSDDIVEGDAPTGFINRLFGKRSPERDSDEETSSAPSSAPSSAAATPTLVEESAPREAVTPDDRAPEEIEEAPVLEQKDFGDRLVQAMQKERSKEVNPKNRATANKHFDAKPIVWSKDKAEAPRARVREVELSAQPLRSDVKVNQSNWYVRTERNQMQIRLTGPLAVGRDGELAFTLAPNEKIEAMFDLVSGNPVIIADGAKVLVNNEPVEQQQELASGDKIEVAGKVMQLFSQSDSKTSGSAASS
jgi:hypothetical protein